MVADDTGEGQRTIDLRREDPDQVDGVIDDETCLRLLATQTVGRVAVTLGALPAIFPVRYVMCEGAVYVRTGEGTHLTSAMADTVVAFEIDSVDPVSLDGWSVQVMGQARPSFNPRLSAMIEPVGERASTALMRIGLEMVTGRRIRRGVTLD